MTNFEMFKGNIKPKKYQNMKDWQVGRKLELKHKNGIQFSMKIKNSLTLQLSIFIYPKYQKLKTTIILFTHNSVGK